VRGRPARLRTGVKVATERAGRPSTGFDVGCVQHAFYKRTTLQKKQCDSLDKASRTHPHAEHTIGCFKGPDGAERAGRPGTENSLGQEVKNGRASDQSIDGEWRETVLVDPCHKPSDYSPSNKEAHRKADGQKLPLR
jgi:hypothetical protein